MTPIHKVPAYAKLQGELEVLCTALGKVEARIAEVEARLRQGQTPQERDSSRVASALAFAETGAVHKPAIESLQDEHIALREQREAVERAIGEKRLEMRDLAGELSALVCREQEPAHRKFAARYVAALRALDALHAEEEAMVSAMNAAGYQAGHIRAQVRWRQVGVLSDPNSLISGHMRSVEQYASKGA